MLPYYCSIIKSEVLVEKHQKMSFHLYREEKVVCQFKSLSIMILKIVLFYTRNHETKMRCTHLQKNHSKFLTILNLNKKVPKLVKVGIRQVGFSYGELFSVTKFSNILPITAKFSDNLMLADTYIQIRACTGTCTHMHACMGASIL